MDSADDDKDAINEEKKTDVSVVADEKASDEMAESGQAEEKSDDVDGTLSPITAEEKSSDASTTTAKTIGGDRVAENEASDDDEL